MEALLGGLGLGATLTLTIWALVAERGRGKEKARADVADVRLELAQATITTQSARADFQERRANALDAAIAKLAAKAVGPVAGSFAELLEAANALRAGSPGRGDAPVVRDDGAAREAPGTGHPASDSDLLVPGQ